MKPKSRLFRKVVTCGNLPRADRDASRRWALFAGACAFAIVSVAAPADSASVANELQHPDAASQHEPWPEPDFDLVDKAIAPLRRGAQVGDVDAALAVATRLVERFERGGVSDDLFEATLWIERYHGNETFARSGLLARVQPRDCQHRVLRLHWLCDVAE